MKHVVGFAVWAGQPGGADEYRVAGVGLTHGLGQAKANADAIAAVPDLLEACIAMKQQLEKLSFTDEKINRALRKAFLAIAKATGGAA